MEENTTRMRILNAALNLFAAKGYDGVSIDQIGAEVGIKGPSLYKHFKGKEDILDNLIKTGDSYYYKNFGSPSTVKIPTTMDEFYTSTMDRIEFTMSSELTVKFRRLLVIEQFRSDILRQMADKHNIYDPINLYSVIFSGMINNGLIKHDNPESLALEFISPVTLIIQMTDRNPGLLDKNLDYIRQYIKHFIDVYEVKL